MMAFDKQFPLQKYRCQTRAGRLVHETQTKKSKVSDCADAVVASSQANRKDGAK